MITLALIVVISLVTKAPNQERLQEFGKMENGIK